MTPATDQSSRDGSGEMFDRIAERYDLLNRVMSLGMDRSWRNQAVAELNLRDGDHVLDLATGTADLALAVARHNPTVRVTGLDPSRKMLDIGRSKVQRNGLQDRVDLELGHAEGLSYPDRSFDAICMAFGIRNVPNRSAALREMVRVLRPGGRVCLLELSEPGEHWLGVPARWYVHRVIPFVGGILSGSREYRYLQRSIAAFPPAREFARLMEDAGLRVRALRALGFGACHLYVAEPKELP